MKLVLFVGAGASVELGIPAMRPMAEQFLEHLIDTGVSNELLDNIKSQFDNDSFDIENVIEDTTAISTAQQIGSTWGLSDSDKRVSEIDIVRMEAEWFVQHICERANPAHAKTLWTPSIRKFSEHEVTVVTTNYDRSIEITATSLGIELHDGFDSFADRRYAEWKGFHGVSGAKLLKLHGSTDWYRTGDLKTYKLHHPMPLFGDVTVQVDDLALTHAIVLPSREKVCNEMPFQRLAFEFAKSIDQADVAVFLGTSLRDPHILSLCSECADRVPTIIVSIDIAGVPNSVRNKENLIVLQQCASRFLIGSLPAALRERDSHGFRSKLESESSEIKSVLGEFLVAADTKSPLDERLNAIDTLCDRRMGCEQSYVETLFRSPIGQIRIHALGLVLDSPDRSELLEVVRRLARDSDDVEFKRESDLLRNLMATAGT